MSAPAGLDVTAPARRSGRADGRAPGRRRWGRGLVALVTLVVVAVVGALVVRHQLMRSDPASVQDAFRRFGGDLGPVVDGLPVPGVYTVISSGGETLDALGGISHTYPDVAPLIVRRVGCGYAARWELLAQRWEELEVCPSSEGWQLRRVRAYHEFIGTRDEREYVCEPGSLLLPATWRAGDRFTATCGAPLGSDHEGVLLRWTNEVVGPTTVDVGEMRPAVHLRVDVEHVSGPTVGGARLERWVDPRTGLVLRETKDASTTSPSIVGAVTHEETYDLRITSLDPLR